MRYLFMVLILCLCVGCSNQKVLNDSPIPNSDDFIESAKNNDTHPVEYSYEHFFVEDVIYEVRIAFAKINDHSDPEVVPKIKLFLEVLNNNFDVVYKTEIGEYISGNPYLVSAQDFTFVENAILVCKTWYGGGGDYIIVSENDGELSILEAPADIGFELINTTEIMSIDMKDVLNN